MLPGANQGVHGLDNGGDVPWHSGVVLQWRGIIPDSGIAVEIDTEERLPHCDGFVQFPLDPFTLVGRRAIKADSQSSELELRRYATANIVGAVAIEWLL